MNAEAPAVAPDAVAVALARADALEDAIPDVPTTLPPSEISEDDANALLLEIGMVSRGIQETEAAVTRWADDQRARLNRIDGWYGKALFALAKARIGTKSPRRIRLPFGELSLRKAPDKLEAKEGEEAARAFKVFDARADHKWTRVKARFDSLTRTEFDSLLNLLDEALTAKLHYEYEPCKADLVKLWKDTGEVAAGFQVVWGEDSLTIGPSTTKEIGK